MATTGVTFTTVLFNGITAAVADVALNDISRANNFAKLRPYFEHKSILQAAGYAGLTVMVGAAAVLLTTQLLLGYTTPRQWTEVLLTLGVSFGIGVGMDVLIRRFHVFSGLDAYYNTYGAGVWGGASLVVSMAVALAMQAYVLPLLHPL